MSAEARPSDDIPHVRLLEVLVGVVISAIEDKPRSFFGRKGRIGVTITDDRSLTLSFGDLNRPLILGVAEGCDLRLTMAESVLAQILDGTIDAVHQLTSGGLLLEGDLELLPPLFQLLDRGRSLLSIRLGR